MFLEYQKQASRGRGIFVATKISVTESHPVFKYKKMLQHRVSELKHFDFLLGFDLFWF